jgi:hypothetical protein
MGRYKSSAQQLIIDERRTKVVQLRKSGATLAAIAKVISSEFDAPKYCEKSAHRDVMESLKLINQSYRMSTEEYRQLELERLDDYLFRLQVKLRMGDVPATLAALKIGERRAKLMGLEAPIQIQIDEGIKSELTIAIDLLEAKMSPDSYRELLSGLREIGESAAMAGSN